jgi:hypothetical protein
MNIDLFNKCNIMQGFHDYMYTQYIIYGREL